MKNLFPTIGKAIRIAIQKFEITLEKLAEVSGIHRQWIGRWERNISYSLLRTCLKLKESRQKIERLTLFLRINTWIGIQNL